MQIITTLPTSERAIKDALIKEITTGFELIKANERREEIKARRDAQNVKNHRTIAGLGKCVAMFPPDEYFRMVKKFGRKEVLSKDFLKFYRKKFPDLCPNRV